MCVWYLKERPLCAWVPTRHQIEGSVALRDYISLLSHVLFHWIGAAVLRAGIRFLRVMLSFLRLLHLRWVRCHIIALLGTGCHRKDKNSCPVNHCLTSHYSSLWDVQIDRILYTLNDTKLLVWDHASKQTLIQSSDGSTLPSPDLIWSRLSNHWYRFVVVVLHGGRSGRWWYCWGLVIYPHSVCRMSWNIVMAFSRL